VEPEDVVDALRNMVDAVRPGGIVLDLQVVRPKPRIESDGQVLCELVAEQLLRKADAAAAAVDAFVAEGRLVEEVVDDHAVLQHFRGGADLVASFTDPERSLPAEALPLLQALQRPCVRRDSCRLRRLRLPLRTNDS
jgi:hypothetical protein